MRQPRGENPYRGQTPIVEVRVRAVETCYHRYRSPDDMAVSFFLCAHSRKSPEMIYGMRRQGLTWFEISRRLRVPTDVWYVPFERHPGPPYGKAWATVGRNRPNTMVWIL